MSLLDTVLCLIIRENDKNPEFETMTAEQLNDWAEEKLNSMSHTELVSLLDRAGVK